MLGMMGGGEREAAEPLGCRHKTKWPDRTMKRIRRLGDSPLNTSLCAGVSAEMTMKVYHFTVSTPSPKSSRWGEENSTLLSIGSLSFSLFSLPIPRCCCRWGFVPRCPTNRVKRWRIKGGFRRTKECQPKCKQAGSGGGRFRYLIPLPGEL